jgi:hypothetical protein
MTEPIGLRGNITWWAPREREGFTIQSGTRYPCRDEFLHIYKDGKLIYSENYPDNVWRGHCAGELIIAPLLKRLKDDDLDPIDRDPPDEHGERMVADFEALARTLEAALSDPVLRKQIDANMNLLEESTW